ncbi:MAG TPA: zinc-binding dehydrogenase, partial [Mycobacterium sp.]|nr:zinc-binding dehydrogenase [Mycobacterium sp.]
GSFFASDGTCPNCRNGVQTSCLNSKPMVGCQAEAVRVPWADGSLVATPEQPSADLVPSLLAASDVMGTGWFAAHSAQVAPGMTVAIVGDGAVGLCGVIAAKRMGAERIVVMSRHETRQRLAREFGATDIVEERGADGVAHIQEMTEGIGADAVLECVGTDQAMQQAIESARPGAFVGFVGLPHGVSIDGAKLFRSQVGLRGGPAPVRHFLPELISLIFDGTIDPGRVFDTTMPLDDVAEAYAAMDQRRAIKVLLQP